MFLSLFPLLLLTTAIGSLLWYQRTGNDIFYALAAVSAATCVIWGLVVAHWIFQVIALVLLLRLRTPAFRPIQAKVSDDLL